MTTTTKTIEPGTVVSTVGPHGQPNALTHWIGLGRVESLHHEIDGGVERQYAFVQWFNGNQGSWPVEQLRRAR